MYNHPISVQYAVDYHQQELLREASQARLAKEAGGEGGSHRVVAIAIAVAVILGTMVLVVL